MAEARWELHRNRIAGLTLVLYAVTLGGCDVITSPWGKQDAPTPTTSALSLLTDTTPASITLTPAIRYQTITGWEAHPQSGFERPDFHLYRDSLFNLVVNDLGINRLRLEVKSGAENTTDYYRQWRSGSISDSTWRCVRFSTVNDNADPNAINWNGFNFSALDTIVENVVLPIRQRLADRGEQLFINLEYVAFTGQNCSGRQYHHDDSPQEYAEFILAATLHLRDKYGLTPDAWEVILEPDNTTFWRGPRIGAAIVATAAKLATHGYTPRFIAPSTARAFNAVPYFDQMVAQVPAAIPFLRELSYHRYSTPSDNDLSLISARAAQYGIQASMLEKIKADHHALHSDLKFANITSWQQFALAFGLADDGAQYYRIDRTNPSNPKVLIGSRTKYLRQYFRFVRSGAVRIAASSSNTTVDPLAFINRDGGHVVIVKSSSSLRLPFSIPSLPAGSYGLISTNGLGVTVNWPDLTIADGQVLHSFIPPKAVMTIYPK